MTHILGVESEVGQLRRAIVHRPGLELTHPGAAAARPGHRRSDGRHRTSRHEVPALPAHLHNPDTDLRRRLQEQSGLGGAEVSDDVFESPASIVFDQAENRLHTIKAVMVNAIGSTS